MKKLATVCMMKDEESVIGRMIESVAPITDLFIFTDTGSTDNTKKVVKEKCKKLKKDYELFETKFIDFGTSRTETIQNAIGKADYLLLLDADMTIENHGFNVDDLDKDGYHVFYTGDNYYAQLLLVNGKLNWKYYGKTHEYVYTEEMQTIGTLKSMKINHLLDGSNRKEKFNRDINLLKESIKENPKDRRAYFYLAESYRNNNQPAEAAEYYRQRIAMGGWKEEVYYSIYQLGRMLFQLNETDQARATLMDAWEFRPERLESIYALALLLRQTKKYNQAVLFLEKALETPFPEKDVLFVEKPIYDFLLRFEYSINLFYIGKKKQALRQCEILLKQENIPENFYNQVLKNVESIKNELKRDNDLKKSNPKYNKNIVFVSAYTKDTPYEEEVKKLKKNLEKFDLKHVIYEIPNQGTWIKNTCEKPKYIFRALEENKCPVVWIDADTEILEKPDYFHSVTNDIQFHLIKEWDDYFTGTLFLNYNRRVKEFLSNWIFDCEVNNKPDGYIFKVLMKNYKDIDVGDLPLKYAKIFDNPLQKHCKDPVIVHNQASRRFKVKIQKVNFVKNFDKKTRELYKSIAVVGNGPFANNMKGDIDNSYVVRCNDFKIGKEYKGIGEKTNLNLSSLYHEIIPSQKKEYPILGAHPISNIIGNYSDAKKMHTYWNTSKHKLLTLGNDILTFNEGDEFFDIWVQLADKLQGFPTTGLVGIALARYWGYKQIVLSGFNFFSTEKTHYWKEEKVRPSAHHKVETEREIVKNWIQKDGIEYILDKETKKSLL